MSNCVLRDILYLLIWEGDSVLLTLLVHNACLYTKRTVVRNTIMMIRDSPGEFLTERLRCLISQSYFYSFCPNLSLACRSEMSARLQWNKWTHHSPVTVSRWCPHTSCFISAEFALVLSVEHIESVHHSKMTYGEKKIAAKLEKSSVFIWMESEPCYPQRQIAGQ